MWRTMMLYRVLLQLAPQSKLSKFVTHKLTFKGVSKMEESPTAGLKSDCAARSTNARLNIKIVNCIIAYVLRSLLTTVHIVGPSVVATVVS